MAGKTLIPHSGGRGRWFLASLSLGYIVSSKIDKLCRETLSQTKQIGPIIFFFNI